MFPPVFFSFFSFFLNVCVTTLDTQNLGVLSVLMIIYLPIYRKEYEQDESSLTETLSLFKVVFYWKPAVFRFLRAMEGGEETRGTLF